MFQRIGVGVIIAALVSFGAACGNDDDAAAPDDVPEDAVELTFTAIDIDFEEKELTASAGELAVTLANEGEIDHTLLFEGYEDDLRLVVDEHGDVDTGTITLDAGEYVYYCDVPGHRAAGMEGVLTLE